MKTEDHGSVEGEAAYDEDSADIQIEVSEEMREANFINSELHSTGAFSPICTFARHVPFFTIVDSAGACSTRMQLGRVFIERYCD